MSNSPFTIVLQEYDGAQDAVVRIPEGVTHIAAHAFEKHGEITCVQLPNTLREIGLRAFADCTQLKDAVLPTSLQKLGKEAFCSCYALEDAFLPESVTVLDDEAFRECRGLRSVTLPGSMEHLGKNLFRNCFKLQDLQGAEPYAQAFPDAFPRDFIEGLGLIRPQDKWMKEREFKQAHEDYAQQIQQDIAQYQAEINMLEQRIGIKAADDADAGEAATQPPTQADYERLIALQEMLVDAEALLVDLKHPSWEVLTDHFAANHAS